MSEELIVGVVRNGVSSGGHEYTVPEAPTYLFSGEGLRTYLARSLVNALTGLLDSNLRKNADVDEWVEHLVAFHMPTVPKLNWDRLTFGVTDGKACVRVAALETNDQVLLNADGRLMFEMKAESPLPPGGIKGYCDPRGLCVFTYGVKEFNAIKTAIEANLHKMDETIAAFTPLFRQVVREDILVRLAQHQADIQLKADFVRLLGAREAPFSMTTAKERHIMQTELD